VEKNLRKTSEKQGGTKRGDLSPEGRHQKSRKVPLVAFRGDQGEAIALCRWEKTAAFTVPLTAREKGELQWASKKNLMGEMKKRRKFEPQTGF